jgi:RIO-like serine/threonine protein kinase
MHGDLSEFNILVGSGGPVIIDLLQAVDATGNNHAKENWALFERGDLSIDSPHRVHCRN